MPSRPSGGLGSRLLVLFVFALGACKESGTALPKLPTLPEAGDHYCPDGYSACDYACCPTGASCVAGACKYPYDTAHLYVYLCPSFNTGNCSASFFALDQTCAPITAAQAGTCYDTGFEVGANQSYGLASCTKCGSSCGSPGSFSTPEGFVSRIYYSGITWSCGAKCDAPADCGGAVTGAGVEATCATGDCWLSSLSVQKAGSEVPLVVVAQASAAATSAASPSLTPSFTAFNGTGLSSGGASLMLSFRADEQAQFDYDFNDPTGCSPGVCFSVATCPKNLRCTLGTKMACTRPMVDGALAGSVMRTLGFKAEPAGASTTAEVGLAAMLIVAPTQAPGEPCDDVFDDSDPENVRLAKGVLVSDPLLLDVTIEGAATSVSEDGGVPTSDAGAADAAVANVCCCDFRTDQYWHCTNSDRSAENALCSVPWPDCCSVDYTICE